MSVSAIAENKEYTLIEASDIASSVKRYTSSQASTSPFTLVDVGIACGKIGFVHVKGNARMAVSENQSVVVLPSGTLPVNLRPSEDMIVLVNAGHKYAGKCIIRPNGSIEYGAGVSIASGQWLDGVGLYLIGHTLPA